MRGVREAAPYDRRRDLVKISIIDLKRFHCEQIAPKMVKIITVLYKFHSLHLFDSIV